MVALLQPAALHRTPAPSAVRRPARHLQLVPASSARTADPLSIAGVAAVMAMVLLVVLVRGVQGAPPADDWATLTESPGVVHAGAVETVTVVEGDTWASITERVSPGADPVAFARSAASVNGGYQLRAGQVLQLASSE